MEEFVDAMLSMHVEVEWINMRNYLFLSAGTIASNWGRIDL